jgi:hypothetical protein
MKSELSGCPKAARKEHSFPALYNFQNSNCGEELILLFVSPLRGFVVHTKGSNGYTVGDLVNYSFTNCRTADWERLSPEEQVTLSND